MTVPGAARWEVTGTNFTPVGGVVTELGEVAGPVAVGEVLIRLNERPMIAIPGEVPVFRVLEEGSVGRDVKALNAYLAGMGHNVDPESEVYGTATMTAVTEWHENLGVASDGRVALGDILFLPAEFFNGPPYRLLQDITVGATISEGAPLLERLAAAPNAVMEFGGSAPAEIVPGLLGVATFPGADRVDVSVGRSRIDEGRASVELTAPDGGALCAPSACLELVPPAGDVSISVELTLVPRTSGPVVPSAAIASDASGSPFVVLADGTRRTIEVVVSDGGLTVVSGIEPGDEIRLP